MAKFLARLRLLLLVVLLLLLAGLAFLWWNVPRLVAYAPHEDGGAMPANSGLQITFSRPMQPAAVEERLRINPAIPGSFSWLENTLTFLPEKPWQAGAIVQVQLAPGARAATWPAVAMRQEVSFSFSVRQPRLLYLYPSDGAANIYMLDPLSEESQALTNLPGGVQDFQVSPDGAALYYSTRLSQAGSAIYRLDLAAASETADGLLYPSALVLNCPQAVCRSPVVSPVETYLAYERTPLPESGEVQPNQVWYIRLPVEGMPKLGLMSEDATLAGDPAHQTLQPEWSSQSLLAFYDTNTQAYVIFDPARGELTHFANQTGEVGDWHPSGQFYLAPEIIFLDENISEALAGLDRLSASHLMLFDWQAGTTRDLTREENMEDAAPAFSPDGRQLLFARKSLDLQHWTPGRQIWLMSMDDGSSRPLTSEPDYHHFNFAWSPSGDQAAYVRFNQSVLSEPPEVWVISLATGQARQIVVGGYLPRWIP